MKFLYSVVWIIMAASISSCDSSASRVFDLQGHRGARGLMPENTIPAFLSALDYGVTTLELDVVVSADSQVVVSHEPWLSSEICLAGNGSGIPENSYSQYNIFRMTYDSIARYDCGMKEHPRFPGQKKMHAVKPLLSSVFEEVERYLVENSLDKVAYNIEIKSRQEGDGIYHPDVSTFSDLVYHSLVSSGIDMSRFIIQSFDFRVLKHWHKTYPAVQLAALVEGEENPATDIDNLKAQLGFTPDIYSPDYSLLTAEKISDLQAEGIRVIPWTVNEPEDMEKMRRFGVDGLITDYPDRAQFLLSHK
jgi:glycerophosphoryl diester phosphodiesterase